MALVADPEVVACQWRIRATHATSGNAIDVQAAEIFRIRAGRLAELRRFLDLKSLDRQTQASPGASAPDAARAT